MAKVPYHVSVHDYPDAHHPEKKFGQRITKHLVSQFEQLYKRAASRDVISHEMAADLKERTRAAADEIFNAGVEPEDFAYLETKPFSNPKTIKLAHAGTIVAEETFVRFVGSIRRLREVLSKPMELHLFGAHAYRERSWFAPEWMVEYGNLPPEQFRLQLRACQWGIVPMDLTDQNASYNQFSLPSKVVTYLANGLAIISYGHKNSTIAGLARRYSFGVALENEDESELDCLLTQSLGEEDVWGRYAEEILRCAHREFDAVSMRGRLHDALGVEP